MSNFFNNIINRHLGLSDQVMPRKRSVFEPESITENTLSVEPFQQEKKARPTNEQENLREETTSFLQSKTIPNPINPDNKSEKRSIIPESNSKMTTRIQENKQSNFSKQHFIKKPAQLTLATPSIRPIVSNSNKTINISNEQQLQSSNQPIEKAEQLSLANSQTVPIVSNNRKTISINNKKLQPQASNQQVEKTKQLSLATPPTRPIVSNKHKSINIINEDNDFSFHQDATENLNQHTVVTPSSSSKHQSFNTSIKRTAQNYLPSQSSQIKMETPVPTVKIHIGRIEIKAIQTPKTEKKRKITTTRKPKMSLDQYLKKQQTK